MYSDYYAKEGSKMCKFTIDYYYKKYHTGDTNKEEWRTATVIANTLEEALNKVRTIDPSYIMDRNVSFEVLVLYT